MDRRDKILNVFFAKWAEWDAEEARRNNADSREESNKLVLDLEMQRDIEFKKWLEEVQEELQTTKEQIVIPPAKLSEMALLAEKDLEVLVRNQAKQAAELLKIQKERSVSTSVIIQTSVLVLSLEGISTAVDALRFGNDRVPYPLFDALGILSDQLEASILALGVANEVK